jgi:ABC-2 type transport system permease protein
MSATADASSSPARRTIRLIRSLLAINIRARMEYRVDFLVWLVLGMAFQVAALAFVWVVVAHFGGVGDWTLDEVLFIVGIRLLAHALFETVFGNLTQVAWMIRDGWMDRILLRPVSPLLQVVMFRFRANGVGDLVVGMMAFAKSVPGIDVAWTPIAILDLALVLAGSVLLEAGILLAIAALSFRVVRTDSLTWWADDLGNSFANYPLTVFPFVAQFLLTWIVPIAFLGFFPAAALLGRADAVPFSPLLAYGAPLVGVGVFTAAVAAWRSGIGHHRSTGT